MCLIREHCSILRELRMEEQGGGQISEGAKGRFAVQNSRVGGGDPELLSWGRSDIFPPHPCSVDGLSLTLEMFLSFLRPAPFLLLGSAMKIFLSSPVTSLLLTHHPFSAVTPVPTGRLQANGHSQFWTPSVAPVTHFVLQMPCSHLAPSSQHKARNTPTDFNRSHRILLQSPFFDSKTSARSKHPTEKSTCFIHVLKNMKNNPGWLLVSCQRR